ncbi:MAG: glycosyltransferase family 4 protein [Planctomycetes bacterium]|nr:glycosyltransferase family 4 protein [Planctomycetota bacterium]
MHRAGQPILIAVRGLDPVGTGRQAELLARGLAASGQDVHVAITSSGGSLAARLRKAEIPIHRVGRRPCPDLAAAARLVAVIRRLRAAVVVPFGRRQAALAAVARAANPRIRVVAHVAAPPRNGRQGRILRAADRVVAAFSGVADSCRQHGVPTDRLTTIPPGIAADEPVGLARGEVAERLGLDPACAWTLSVTPLVAEARLERLVWGIDQLGAVRKGVQHVVVGAGPQWRRLWRRARVQELAERLVVLADCDLLPDLLGQVGYVWQSGTTACGGVILDAMARGVPAVAVASAAARELVASGTTGWVVPPLPESELPRRAFTLLEHPDEAARFGEAARVRAVEMFPAERMMAAFAAAIDAVG